MTGMLAEVVLRDLRVFAPGAQHVLFLPRRLDERVHVV
jgi:hypothetical protein